jgi:hypothetical protein
MTTINCCFVFLSQIQKSTIFPRNCKSRCINLPRSISGSTSTLGDGGDVKNPEEDLRMFPTWRDL